MDTFIAKASHFWISPESAQANFPRRNRANWIDNNRNERLLVALIGHLGRNIDARQPASVSRMAVVPPNSVLFPTNLQKLKTIKPKPQFKQGYLPALLLSCSCSCIRRLALERLHEFLCLRLVEQKSPWQTWRGHRLFLAANPWLPGCPRI